ncbi:MAG: AraC-like DNA-binding protein [Marivirga sp.]|jgi:AraC-like DNA-binding protein
MIDLSHHISQKATYTTDNTQLLVTYDVAKVERDYEFDNIIFAYVAKGLKNISIPGLKPFSLTPEMVIMGATAIEAHVDIPVEDKDNPAHCFCLEVSKEKVYSLLDKLYESSEMEKITASSETLSPIEIYQGSRAGIVLNNLISMQQIIESDARFKDQWIDLKIEELIICCLQTNMYQTLIGSYSNDRLLDNPLSEVITYIKSHYTTHIDVNKLAEKACMSPATFYRRFKQSLGVTPLEYIHGERIQKAKQLLGKNNATISDIGYQLGYTSPSYFTLQFEKHLGCSPRAYQKKHLN